MNIKKIIIKRGIIKKLKWQLGKGWLSHLTAKQF
jgi:hypothetical protein